MNEHYKDLLKHMLGADSRYKKKQWGFRNHFCAGAGHSDLKALVEMEKAGLVKRFSSQITEEYINFRATAAGAVSIGFKSYQLKNAGLKIGAN